MADTKRKNGRSRFHDWWNPDLTHPQCQNLAGWWPAREGGGLMLHDVGGRHLDAMMSGMSPSLNWSLGDAGDVVLYDGSPEYAEVQFDSGLFTFPVSMCMWFARVGATEECFAITNSLSNTVYISLGTSSGKFRVLARGGGPNRTLLSNRDAVVGEWVFFCMVARSMSERELWIDGELDAVDVTDADLIGIDTISWGRNGRASPQFGRGDIGSSWIFAEALNHDQINAIYNDPWAPNRRIAPTVFVPPSAPAAFNPAWAHPATKIGI